MTKEEVWSNAFLCIYKDKTIGISDGVGYVDTMKEEEVKEMYEQLKTMFEGGQR